MTNTIDDPAPPPSPTSGSIRPGTRDDGPALRTLQTFLAEPSPTTLEAALGGVGVLLVADSPDSPPIGYVIGVPGDSIAWIAELVVAPQARGQGRGRALLGSCCARLADDHDRVRLAVAADNDRARSLYRSMGFDRVDRSETAFETGTALVYERSI